MATTMGKTELIDRIVRLEWDDFSHVNNNDATVTCQSRPDTFTRMRRALLETWGEELLASYLQDVSEAREAGRSLMSEKYAWMMETTDPAGFAEVAALLPDVPAESRGRIERIAKISLVWQAQANALLPRLTAGGRALIAEDDRTDATSFETYLRGELMTYSARTLAIYERDVLACWRAGRNLAIANLDNIARSYGYRDAADAERRSG